MLLSLLLALALGWLRLPAALLLGPMAAALVFATREAGLRVPAALFEGAQAVIGGMIATALPVSIFVEMEREWPVLAGGVLAVIAASAALGWLLTRWRVLPGATAIWGCAPGAATVMTLMSQSHGADMRLVALMQYLRVVIVAVLATVIARLLGAPAPHGTALALHLLAPLAWQQVALTLLVLGVCGLAGRALRIPAGPLLVPLIVGTLLEDTGIVTLSLPPWLLALAYLTVGWGIGLRFDRSILVAAAAALPRILASLLCLVAVCAAFGMLLARLVHVDPLTAYLATSPGGADSIAIIASSTRVNVPFVLAMQSARFLLVLATGPALARRLDAAAHRGLEPSRPSEDGVRGPTG